MIKEYINSFSVNKIILASGSLLVALKCILAVADVIVNNSNSGLYTSYYTVLFCLFSLRNGFAPRSVIGTLWDFCSESISWQTFAILNGATFVLYMTVLAFFLYRSALKSQTPTLQTSIVFLYFSLPVSYVYFSILASADMYLYMIFIICVLLIQKKTFFPIPFLFALALLIHESFFFIYLFPLIALAIYEISWKEKKQRRKILVFFLGTALTLGIVVFARHCGRINGYSAEILKSEPCRKIVGSDDKKKQYLYAILKKTSNVNINASTSTWADHWNFWKSEMFGSSKKIFLLTINIIILFPIMLLLITLWKILYKQIDSYELKLKLLLLVFSFSTIIPLFVFATDSGRWFGGGCFAQIAIWLMISKNIKLDVSRSLLALIIAAGLLYSLLGYGLAEHVSKSIWEIGDFIKRNCSL